MPVSPLIMRRRIRYDDFALEVRPDNDGRFQVRVRAPLGGPAELFRPPFDPAAVMETLTALEETVRGRHLRPYRPGRQRHAAPEEVGAALFDALFSDRILETFLESWGHVQARRDCGLRIRLMLDPSLPGLASICALPWELLYRRRTREFLSRSVLSPVVRYLDTQSPWLETPAATARRLRVLVAMASPRGCAELDLARERRQIESAWASRWARVSFLKRATISGLQERLRSESFQVLHFMGHGDFDPITGEGRLLFEDGDREASPVSGELLAEACRESRDLQLFFLNACDTARLPRRHGQDPYTGVASAMVLRGAPAVVAMQFPITDEAAIIFSGALYGALAAGDPVDTAVAEGRRAVYLASQSSSPACGPLEWAIPVLFLSAPDVVIVTRRSWQALAALLVLMVLALAAEGTPADGARLDPVAEELRAAFSLGASLAMLGQSSQSVGKPIFEVALQRLGLPPSEVAALCREYGDLEKLHQAGHIGTAGLAAGRGRLLNKAAAQMQVLAGSEGVPCIALGHDAVHLFLLLTYWDRFAPEEALAAARQDLAGIRSAAGRAGLPERTAEELEALGTRDLGRPEERETTRRSIQRVLRRFTISPS